ncbi:PQQ-binding-like beta-propeller repeat protein [Arthrobacter sp. zg-Y1110]|uniref:outer membrane protein assembly factor BamB family protein n=1 Tax=Arthrobacter sp. zg-Y1110 TaxID=2886932 RepID=UPI001D14740F|nr:PQQ-binding-like beta-propeller repeat protein [Arthrobacter sp. zg-Y1110]MCC3291852.1 PQQ-binding-like beta-propeller repeat protein [Arthrobacter sp. zg-Y1110]UWX85680.1 PQQ-binding-like beta-propeller repeat protein [Arthrobacter sp. zg-Y1110]
MPYKKPSVFLPAMALSAALLLSGCGGSDSDAANSNGSGGESKESAKGKSESDFKHLSIFDVEAEVPEDVERVPLEFAGSPREEMSAHDGKLFTYDNNSLFVADYATGKPPAGYPTSDGEGSQHAALYRGMGFVELFTLPVAADGYLYFSDRSVEGEPDDGEQELARFDLATGLPEVLATTTEFPQITVHDGVLYYLADGLLTALDTGTGNQLWQVDCDVESALDVVLAVSDNAVGVMHTYTFDAFNLEDGEQVVDRDAETFFVGLAAGPDDFYLAERTEETQSDYFTSASNLYRISGSSGDEEKIATTRETDSPELTNLQMAVHDGTIVLKSDSEVHAVDEASGETRWIASVRDKPFDREFERDIPYVDLFAAFDADTVYIYATGEAEPDDEDTTSRLLALDIASGEMRAAYDIDAPRQSAGPKIDGGNLLIHHAGSSQADDEVLVLPTVP